MAGGHLDAGRGFVFSGLGKGGCEGGKKIGAGALKTVAAWCKTIVGGLKDRGGLASVRLLAVRERCRMQERDGWAT